MSPRIAIDTPTHEADNTVLHCTFFCGGSRPRLGSDNSGPTRKALVAPGCVLTDHTTVQGGLGLG